MICPRNDAAVGDDTYDYFCSPTQTWSCNGVPDYYCGNLEELAEQHNLCVE